MSSRTSKRSKKQTIFYYPTDPIIKCKNKKQKVEITPEEKEVKKITNLFEDFISDMIPKDYSNDKKEKRLVSLKTKLKKAIELNKEIRYMHDGSYLVTSSNKKDIYKVKMKYIENGYRFTCQCGDKYNDYNRVNCKHVLAITMYHMKFMCQSHIDKFKDPLNNIDNMLESITFN